MAGVRTVCSIRSNVCGAMPRKERKKMLVAVYEETEEQHRHGCVSSIQGSRCGKSIRLCKGRLTAACNPGVCDCPDKGCRMRKKKTEKLWLLMKLALFGYAVEEAYRFGIWSDGEKTEELTNRYLDWAEEFFWTRTKTVRDPEQLYDMARIQYNLKNAWNNTIIGLGSFLTGTIPDLAHRAVGYVMPPPPPPPEPASDPRPRPVVESFCDGNPPKWAM